MAIIEYRIFADTEEEAEQELDLRAEKRGATPVVTFSAPTKNGRWQLYYYWKKM